MSISEDYEKYRIEIGIKKYKALEEYIMKFGKIEEWRKGIKKLRDIKDLNEYDREYLNLVKKCRPIFIEDVVLNVEENTKFEKWYKEKIACEEKNIANSEEEL